MFLFFENFFKFLLSFLFLVVVLRTFMRTILCNRSVCDKLFTAILTYLFNLNHAAHKNVFKNISGDFSRNFAEVVNDLANISFRPFRISSYHFVAARFSPFQISTILEPGDFSQATFDAGAEMGRKKLIKDAHR